MCELNFIQVHLHSTMESLEKFVPIEILPNEYGGKAGAVIDLHNAQIKKLEDHRDWFLEEESRARIDQSKRPGKGKAVVESSKVETNFDKLSLLSID